MRIEKNPEKYEIFKKDYWSYYLELEEQFLNTKKYVSIDSKNFRTYSPEFLRLLEAICSEIDIVGKTIAHELDNRFKVNDFRSSIQKWWYIVQDLYKNYSSTEVILFDEIRISPWKEYVIEKFEDKQGSVRYRMTETSKPLTWWKAYNDVKHNRTLDNPETNEKNYYKANLGNVCYSLAALYLLEKTYIKSVGEESKYDRREKSKLFEKTRIPYYTSDKHGIIFDGKW